MKSAIRLVTDNYARRVYCAQCTNISVCRGSPILCSISSLYSTYTVWLESCAYISLQRPNDNVHTPSSFLWQIYYNFILFSIQITAHCSLNTVLLNCAIWMNLLQDAIKFPQPQNWGHDWMSYLIRVSITGISLCRCYTWSLQMDITSSQVVSLLYNRW